MRFVGKIAFAEARSKDNAELVDEYGITSFPTLVVIPAEGEYVKYAGKTHKACSPPPLSSSLPCAAIAFHQLPFFCNIPRYIAMASKQDGQYHRGPTAGHGFGQKL